jgi:aminopeptidase N
VALTVPDSFQAIGNGQLRGVQPGPAGWATYEWFVGSPINNYDVAAYVGKYSKWAETYDGEGGKLTLTFWPLTSHLNAARTQFQQVKPMLACFEHWFGPYPWYRDGFQLVEAPFLGMEHQSAIAYGNDYQNGYRGTDMSGTGLGLTWDYIIVHESGHEWFGNNLTTADVADMWVHESFATYSEALFVECQKGAAAGAAYVIGTRSSVTNDEPIVGPYGVNARGSEDMYVKGSNMLHTIRHVIGNDSTWHGILRGLNAQFRHQVVTGRQVQAYISEQARLDLSRVFAQYLTTTKIPVFEYRLDGQKLTYRWTDVVPGFGMPLRVQAGGPDRSVVLRPRETWQTTSLELTSPDDFRVDENFFVIARRAE